MSAADVVLEAEERSGPHPLSDAEAGVTGHGALCHVRVLRPLAVVVLDPDVVVVARVPVGPVGAELVDDEADHAVGRRHQPVGLAAGDAFHVDPCRRIVGEVIARDLDRRPVLVRNPVGACRYRRHDQPRASSPPAGTPCADTPVPTPARLIRFARQQVATRAGRAALAARPGLADAIGKHHRVPRSGRCHARRRIRRHPATATASRRRPVRQRRRPRHRRPSSRLRAGRSLRRRPLYRRSARSRSLQATPSTATPGAGRSMPSRRALAERQRHEQRAAVRERDAWGARASFGADVRCGAPLR